MPPKVPVQTSGFNALSPQQQKDHRAKIGVRAQAILGQFWRDSDTPDAVQALEVEGWMDVLENCTHSEIRQAWATYQRSGPRTQAGKLYKPDAGALYRIIMDARPRPRIVRTEPDAPRSEPLTGARAIEIMRDAGFRLDESGNVLSFGEEVGLSAVVRRAKAENRRQQNIQKSFMSDVALGMAEAKRIPKPQTEQQTQDNINEARQMAADGWGAV